MTRGSLRYSPTTITLSGAAPVDRSLWLPTVGLELAMNPTARLVGEVALAPMFKWQPGDPTATIGYGVLGRLGMRWALLPSTILDASFGYQLDAADMGSPSGPRDVVQQWDIRLGAEVFVPWGALACRAVGAFCD